MSGCERAEALLAVRATGALVEAAVRELDEHLSACDTCFQLARQIDREGGLGDELAEVLVGDDFEDLVVVPDDTYVRGVEIGRGGMGRIVHARDRRLGRPVAIKELLDEKQAGRFEREARLTARLQHPAIVNVHEAGRWPSGKPFYAMNYVAGRSLARFIAAEPSLRGRMAVLPNVVTVVEAIAYAHGQRILHRDIKPHNIVLGNFGETVVIDWGLAKDLGTVAAERSDPSAAAAAALEDDLTRAGLGTPAYMAPEQAAGADPDERVDVYALGATLYHLLAGAPPYAGSIEEIARARKDGARALDQVNPEIPRALATIVTKAMEADPAKRYRGAAELAEDLRRFQTGQMVTAHHYTAGEVISMWVRRHRPMVVLAAVAAATLLVVGGVLLRRVLAAQAAAERTAGNLLAEQARQELLAGNGERAAVLADGALAHGIDTPVTRFLLAEAVRVLDPVSWFRRNQFWTGITDTTLLSPDAAQELVLHEDGAAQWIDLETGDTILDIPRERGGADGIFVPGRGILLGNNAYERDPGGSEPRHRPLSLPPGRFEGASADGQIVYRREGANDLLVFRDAASLSPFSTIELPNGAATGIVVDDRAAHAAARHDRAVIIWDAAKGTESARLAEPKDCVNDATLIFDPTGGRLYTFGPDGSSCVWDTTSGLLTGHFQLAMRARATEIRAAFSRDGRWMATFGQRAAPQLWRTDSLEPGPSLPEPTGSTLVAFGDGLFAVADEKSLRLYDASGLVVAGLWSQGRIDELRFTPDGHRIVATSSLWMAQWDASRPGRRREPAGIPPREDPDPRVIFSKSGHLAARATDGAGRSWRLSNLRTGEPLGDVDGTVFAFSPDDQFVVWEGSAGGAQVRALKAPAMDLAAHPVRDLSDARFSPLGSELALADVHGNLSLWRWPSDGADNTALVQTLEEPPLVFAFSPDGVFLATGNAKGEVKLWSARQGSLLQVTRLGSAIRGVAFTPGSDELLAADSTETWRWTVARETRTASEIHQDVADHASLELKDGALIVR